MERTLVLLKPDAVKRKLMGQIINIYERKDLDIVSMKLIRATREQAEKHYEEHRGKNFFEELIEYLLNGDICAMVIKGENAVELVRKINGDKDPFKVDLGSIRGMYAKDKAYNLVHASDSIESAEREISIWFPELKALTFNDILKEHIVKKKVVK